MDPAAPNAVASSIVVGGRRASSSEWQMITPLPAASPDALMTTGAPMRRIAPFASAGDDHVIGARRGDAGVRASTFSRTPSTSRSAPAARVGPKIGSPAARNASTMPASSGASGPTSVQSTFCAPRHITSASTSRADGKTLGELRDARISGSRDQLGDGDHPASVARRARVRARRRPRSVTFIAWYSCCCATLS